MESRGPANIDTIKVLIVSDSSARAEELKLLLGQAYLPLDVVSTVGTKQCLPMVRDFLPDVVLFIEEDAKVPASEISREVYQNHPGTATVILTTPAKQETVSYMRQASLAGARDVLPFPPILDHLVTSIQQAYQLEKGRRPTRARREYRREERRFGGRLIAVYSPKGGCGSSVLAANLAVMLTQVNPQAKTILFDLDLQYGDQRVLLDLQSSHSILDMLPVIDELTRDTVDSALATHSSGLRVLLAPPELSQADLIDEDAARKILAALRAYYDTVIIDVPSVLTDVSITAFEFADLILQLCTLDILSIRRTRALLELYEGLGIPRDAVRLVLNRTNKKSEIKEEDFQLLFENEIMGAIPEDFLFLQPFVNIGVPVNMAPKSEPIVQSLNRIVEKLVASTPTA